MKSYCLYASVENEELNNYVILISNSREKLIDWLEKNRPDAAEVDDTMWFDGFKNVWYEIPLDGIKTI